MGVFNPLTSLSFIFFLFLLIRPLFADIDSRKTPPPPQPPQNIGDIASSNSSSPPPPPPAPPTPNVGDITTTSSNSSSPRQEGRDFSPFRPSIAVIVGVLTTMFSVTFLILLYAKHCKRGLHFNNNSNDHRTYSAPPTTRKNSGIDRAVIESLPIFRFSSLRGQKDGLECAVCLNKFETTEVLKLLPKCKHAFHVECVDTWLDAHSTCPLCRFRIDPEDVLLIGDPKILHENQLIPPTPQPQPRAAENVVGLDIENGISRTELVTRRILGRHSSAGEKASGGNPSNPTVFRKSLDSACKSVAVGCFDRPRKDGMLLTNNKNSCKEEEAEAHRTSLDRRFEHRILVSNSGGGGGGGGGLHQRWSDVHPSDLLYLRSEMIISNSHRLSSSGSGSGGNGGGDSGGRSVINTRSVSEITGLSRSSNTNNSNNTIDHYYYYHHQNIINNRERQEAGVVSRWLAWISSRSQQERTTSSSDTVV